MPHPNCWALSFPFHATLTACAGGVGIISMEMADMAVRRQRFIRDETQVLEYLKPKEDAAGKAGGTSGRRRASGRMTEREEVLVPRVCVRERECVHNVGSWLACCSFSAPPAPP